jgi:hypothetical protein
LRCRRWFKRMRGGRGMHSWDSRLRELSFKNNFRRKHNAR